MPGGISSLWVPQCTNAMVVQWLGLRPSGGKVLSSNPSGLVIVGSPVLVFSEAQCHFGYISAGDALSRIAFFDIKVFNSVFYTQPAMIIKMTYSADDQQTTYFTQGFVKYSNLGPFRRGFFFPYERKSNR